LLQWIFERLAKNNVPEAILAVNRLTGFYIKQQRIPRNGLRIKFSYDPPRMPLGTAGPIKLAEKLIGEKEFSILFHEGERDNIHISIISQRVILVVIFDQRSSLGLVRLRVKKSAEALSNIFNRILLKVEKEKGVKGEAKSPFAEITEEDIDKLFS